MTQLFGDLPAGLLAAVLAAFWLSGVVKGALGFGQPLVAAALASFLIPVETVLVVNALLMPFTNLAQFLAARMIAETLRRVWPIVAGLAVGVPVGAMFVASADEALLLLLVGAVVSGFSILSVAAPTFRAPPRAERPLGFANGAVAGIVGALTTANGPIFVMHLAGLKLSRKLFVSSMGFLFLVSGVMTAAAFSAVGIMSFVGLFLALPALPLVIVGMRLGDSLAKRASESGFRKITLIALFFLGLGLMGRGIEFSH